MAQKLIIKSKDCEDWNGTWFKTQIEADMRELGCGPKAEHEWIDWILDHVFSYEDSLPANIQKVIAESDMMMRIDLRIGDCTATVEKI